jgi:hypothetical protein
MTLKKIIFLSISILLTFYIYSKNDFNNNLIAKKITQILIEEYDKYEDFTALEKLVLKIGRPTYVDNLYIWQNNYDNINEIKIVLHPKLDHMAKIVDKHLEKNTAIRFRNLLEELTLLGFKNLEVYYMSVKEYLENNNLTYDNIDVKLIDTSMCNIKYYNIKKELYTRESVIKNEVQKIMKYDKVKHRLAFYSFALKFLNKIRVKVIQRDMDRMLSIINEKKDLH